VKTAYIKISSFPTDSLPFLLPPDLYFHVPQPWSLSLQKNLQQGISNYFKKIFLHNTEKKYTTVTQLLLDINMAVVPPVAFRHRQLPASPQYNINKPEFKINLNIYQIFSAVVQVNLLLFCGIV